MSPRRPGTAAGTRYVALLCGINVGGNNMVSMADLRGSFAGLGFDDVASYINSGNILFRAKEKSARKLEQKIDRMLAEEHGLPGRTVVRSYAEMKELIATIDRTWKRPSADWRYNVVFLRHTVDAEDVLKGIEPKPKIEQVVYCPGTLLWRARVQDITRTTMLKLASMPVYKEMTIRNLNTTRKVFELMERMESHA